MVTIRFFAAAAQVAGRRELKQDWAGLSIAEILTRLQQEIPSLAPMIPSLAVAVNREYAGRQRVVQAGDEVALLPPVSGGACEKPLFEITTEPLSADEVASRVTNPTSGATLVFVGTVREWTDGKRTLYLEYEAYPEMAVEQLQMIGQEVQQRWPGAQVAIVHRVGKLAVTEPSVVIAVATPHRVDAFEACRHAIERLKQIVPVWKKEVFADGEKWVGN